MSLDVMLDQGNCCGKYVISGFPQGYVDPKKDWEDRLKNAIYEAYDSGKYNGDWDEYPPDEDEFEQLVEITLTDRQLEKMPLLVKALKKFGFVRVCSFVNSNTDNICNVFHMYRNNCLTESKVEY